MKEKDWDVVDNVHNLLFMPDYSVIFSPYDSLFYDRLLNSCIVHMIGSHA
jgi:hypothetical protein